MEVKRDKKWFKEFKEAAKTATNVRDAINIANRNSSQLYLVRAS